MALQELFGLDRYRITRSPYSSGRSYIVIEWINQAINQVIKNTEKALWDVIKKPNKSEIEIMKVARRSLIANRDIRAGEIIKESDITLKRPGTGILPKFKEIVIGMKILKNVSKDEIIKWDDFKWIIRDIKVYLLILNYS